MDFTKIAGSGNDFVIVKNPGLATGALKRLAVSACDRKNGIGADGLLVMEESRRQDARMRIFNADGSEAEMCGNGARCAALYLAREGGISGKASFRLQTLAGIVESETHGNNVRIKLTKPHGLKLGIGLEICGRRLSVNFIDTGVPHAVIFVEGLDHIDVCRLGRLIRYHKAFAPRGTNVNFVQVKDRDTLLVRTYERGVEAETLACGTGSVASALIASSCFNIGRKKAVKIITKGKELLRVYFRKQKGEFGDVWLEGRVKPICKGVWYV